MKKADKGVYHVVFQPTFGNRPDQYIGRDGVIDQFMMGLQEPVGSQVFQQYFVSFGHVKKKPYLCNIIGTFDSNMQE